MWKKNTTFSVSAHPQRWFHLRIIGTQPSINMKYEVRRNWSHWFYPHVTMSFLPSSFKDSGQIWLLSTLSEWQIPTILPGFPRWELNACFSSWPSQPPGNSAKTPENKGYLKCYFIYIYIHISCNCTSHTPKLSFHHCHKTQQKQKSLVLVASFVSLCWEGTVITK